MIFQLLFVYGGANQTSLTMAVMTKVEKQVLSQTGSIPCSVAILARAAELELPSLNDSPQWAANLSKGRVRKFLLPTVLSIPLWAPSPIA